MLLRTKLFGKTYEFPDMRLLMGKANEEKSGDRLAGVGAETAAAVLDPYIKALNSMPRVILAPIFSVWFGLGVWSKVALGFTLARSRIGVWDSSANGCWPIPPTAR